jgi:hypothetical protein
MIDLINPDLLDFDNDTSKNFDSWIWSCWGSL